MLICLTLVPALLGFWPNAVLSRRARRSTAPTGNDALHNSGSRWARLVIRFPILVLLLGVAGLVIAAAPVSDLQLGMPGDESKSTTTTERRAYDALAASFGPGDTAVFSTIPTTSPTNQKTKKPRPGYPRPPAGRRSSRRRHQVLAQRVHRTRGPSARTT